MLFAALNNTTMKPLNQNKMKVQEHYINTENGVEYFTQNHTTYTTRFFTKKELNSLSMCIDIVAEMIEKGFTPVIVHSEKSSVITFKSE